MLLWPPMSLRWSRWRAVALVLLFLAGAAIAAPHALSSIISRASATSFDNPATQLLDELTAEKASYSDPLFEATEAVRAGANSSCRLAAHDGPETARNPGLGFREARAPPSA